MAAPDEPVLREVADGILRLTWQIPLGIDHVHCYFVRVDGGWMIVDTGLGRDDGADAWRRAIAAVGGEVRTILVTHCHPDHVGGATDVAAVTGAPVLQGATDYAHCVRMWTDEFTGTRFDGYLRRHGAPADEAARIVSHGRKLRPYVRFVRDPELLEEGDAVHGWQIVELGGHADGHICLLKDDVLLAGDAILEPITPAIGLFPDTEPDPLGRYQASLRRIRELPIRVAFAGHGRPVADPAARADAILLHHEQRLEAALHAVAPGERTAWDASFELFPGALPPAQRRFALVETLAHLERLVLAGDVERLERGETVTFAASV